MGCSKTDITVWVNAIIHIIQFFIFVPLAGLGLRDANGFSDYSSTPLWQKLLIYICLIITSFVVVFGAFPIDETTKKRIVSIIVSIVSSILMIVFSIIFIIGMATFDFDWDSGDIQNRIEKEKEKKCCFIYSSLDIDSNEVTKSVVNEFSSLYYPLNDNHKNQKNRSLKSKKGGKGGDNSYIGDNSGDYIKVYKDCPYVQDGSCPVKNETCKKEEQGQIVCEMNYVGYINDAPYLCRNLSLKSDKTMMLVLTIVVPIYSLFLIAITIYKILGVVCGWFVYKEVSETEMNLDDDEEKKQRLKKSSSSSSSD